MRYRLSVDFGTTNTAAAIQVEGGEPRPLRLGTRSDSIPSAVTAYQGRLLVGDEAVRLRLLDPSAHEPSPKRRLDAPSIVLAGQPMEPTTMVTAVLREVLRATLVHTNGVPPEQTVLTHPQAWQRPRQELLHMAAVQAGVRPGTIALASEPVSAAWYYAVRTAIAVNDRIAVVDFGGGTFDVAVLSFGAGPDGRRGFAVLGTDGIDPLGGQDFDALLADWVLNQLQLQGRTDLLDRLDAPEGLAARLNLRDQVRDAKHALSEFQSSPVIVSVGDTTTTVTATAAEFESLIGPAVADAIQMTAQTILAADPQGRSRPDSLQRMFLTGGSSLIPLVQRELQRLTNGKVARIDDPKQVTSLGALSCPGLVPFAATPLQGGATGARVPGPADGARDAPPGRAPTPSPPPRPSGAPVGPSGPPRPVPAAKSKIWVWVAAAAALVVLAVVLSQVMPSLGSGTGPGLARSGSTPSPSRPATPNPVSPTPVSPNPVSPTPSPSAVGGCAAELSSSDCATVTKASSVVVVSTCSYDAPGSKLVSCSAADPDTLAQDATVFVHSEPSTAALRVQANSMFDNNSYTGTVGKDRNKPPAKAFYADRDTGQTIGLIYTLKTTDGESIVAWSVDSQLMEYEIKSSDNTVAELLDWWLTH